MPDEACASTTYSEDEFELSLSGVSSVFGVGGGDDDTGPNTRGSHEENEEEEEEQLGADEGGSVPMEPTAAVVALVVSKEKIGGDASDDDATTNGEYSSCEDAPLPLISPSFTGVGERDGRTTKQVCVCADVQIFFMYSNLRIYPVGTKMKHLQV